MATRSRLVVVGASLAGLRAVEAARDAGWSGTVTLVGAEPHLPYDRPPLSKAFLDAGAERHVTPYRTHVELDELQVETRLGTPATGLDPERRVVRVGADEELPYDVLVVATGSQPVLLPGTEGIGGVHTLRTQEDARAVREALVRGARTVVIGAGFIGSEVASAARKRGLPVTIVEQLPVPLVRSLGPEPGEICADLHRAAGTELRLGVGVAGVQSVGGQVTGVELADGTVLPADLVVVGIGARPATDWLRDSGIELHPRDAGVVCDGRLATSLPDVWAAGDVVHAPNATFDGDVMRLEHWTNAAEQGALAARNAVGADAPVGFASVPYFWSDWYGHRLQFVGTPVADEVVVVGPRGPGGTVLYRRGPRLVGVLTIDRPRDVMKLRRRILESEGWADAVAAAEALQPVVSPL